MGIVSFEIVPRSEAALLRELQQVAAAFPRIGMINIPDLLNFDLRSWDAARVARRVVPDVVPHLRAIDFNLNDPSSFAGFCADFDFAKVLVISGDPPQDMSRQVYGTSVTAMIRALKRERPELKVYAGIDPYRAGIRDEFDYVLRKLDAGADGFFTQPFFDVRLMDIYGDLLSGQEVFWGVSPVTSARSQSYWEGRNRVVLPGGFEPTLEWNRRFAGQALDFVERRGGNIYFMPIKVDPFAYLDGILN